MFILFLLVQILASSEVKVVERKFEETGIENIMAEMELSFFNTSTIYQTKSSFQFNLPVDEKNIKKIIFDKNRVEFSLSEKSTVRNLYKSGIVKYVDVKKKKIIIEYNVGNTTVFAIFNNLSNISCKKGELLNEDAVLGETICLEIKISSKKKFVVTEIFPKVNKRVDIKVIHSSI
jgi:hypothetical protein